MRIRIPSDLHREFGPVDLVILAGDIDRGTKGVVWARRRFPETPVLYIAGNHEFYGERIGRLHEKSRDSAKDSNVTILENETFELNEYHFFGATLWTDFALLGDRQFSMLAAGEKHQGMNDYRKLGGRTRVSCNQITLSCSMLTRDSAQGSGEERNYFCDKLPL